MSKNYLTYPFKTMRITQSYTGTTSHLPHTTGNPKDYPLDEGGKDSGRDAFYCPCDEIEIVRVYGVGSGGTNTVWIQSTSAVDCADGTSDYICAQITHPNDSDIKDLKAGQKFKRGQIICYEGTDGATGNHLHISFGKGKISGNGWTRNSKGKYVLTTTGGTFKPEALFYIDTKFTTVVSNKGLKFKSLPEVEVPAQVKGLKVSAGDTFVELSWNKAKGATGYYVFNYNSSTKKYTSLGSTVDTEYKIKGLSSNKSYKFAVQAYAKVGNEKYWGKVSSALSVKTTKPKPKYTTGSYKVTGANVLNVRKKPSTTADAIPYKKLTKSARDKIYKLVGYEADGYVKGLTFSVTKIDGSWGKTPSGWVCLDYCTKI